MLLTRVYELEGKQNEKLVILYMQIMTWGHHSDENGL